KEIKGAAATLKQIALGLDQLADVNSTDGVTQIRKQVVQLQELVTRLSGMAGLSMPSQPRAGALGSSAGVATALKAICEYYEQNEPSSPVSAFVATARHLAGMSFWQIVEVMTPEAMDKLKLILRAAEGKPKS